MNWTWKLPFPSYGAAEHILGGWQFNGIWSSTSGAPIGIRGPDRSGNAQPEPPSGLHRRPGGAANRRAILQCVGFSP